MLCPTNKLITLLGSTSYSTVSLIWIPFKRYWSVFQVCCKLLHCSHPSRLYTMLNNFKRASHDTQNLWHCLQVTLKEPSHPEHYCRFSIYSDHVTRPMVNHSNGRCLDHNIQMYKLNLFPEVFVSWDCSLLEYFVQAKLSCSFNGVL